MKLGVENKKAAYLLSALFVVLGYEFYSNVLAGPSSSDASTAVHVAAPAPGDDSADAAQNARAQIAAHARDEFLPFVHKRGSKPPDPNTVDPTIHTELLAKLNEVPPAGSGRDLFSFGKPAPVLDKGPEPNVQPKWIAIGPRVIQPPVKPGPPPVTPPPPITLKYYGIVTTLVNGKKTAFFMDGDEILLETEGVTFKGRYRLVRIGVNSAVVEDIQYKHEQTLPLAEDAQG
jgi:hypothetical protein